MGAGSFGTLGSLYAKLPFDVQKDLAPIALVATTPYVLVVQPSLPIKTVADLVSYAKANPGKLNFAASTPGSLQRLAGELLKRTAGFDMLYVPYKGTGAMMPDVLGGRLHVVIDNVLTLAPLIRNGTLRGLGVTSGKRSVVLPGFADAFRNRRAGLSRGGLVRRFRYGEDAAGDRHPAQQ